MTSRRWLTRASLGATLAATLGGAGLAPAGGWLGAARAQGPGSPGSGMPGSGTPAAGTSGLLRIGLAMPNTTLDPHFENSPANNTVACHLFDALVTAGPHGGCAPGLALSWQAVGEAQWRLRLRPGVMFSNGAAFTAADAIASLQRANDLPSTASFRAFTRSIAGLAAPDPLTLVIDTRGPDPLLPYALSRIRIIGAGQADAPTTEFNNGNATIGTGALVLEEYLPGQSLRLSRNDDWWGGRLPWAEVALHLLPDDAARVAALLAGELDLIEAVPPAGSARLARAPQARLARAVSSRFVYLAMDQKRASTPFATDAAGQPLPRNPLLDRRVRQALSMAIDRAGLVAGALAGDAVVASQFLPAGSPGTSDQITPTAHAPGPARALLAEAGYPEGFRLTLHGPEGRYAGDAAVLRAIAGMLGAIGVAATAETMPWAEYAARNAQGAFSLSLGAWAVNTGETANPLKALVATPDRAAGLGASNAGRYANAAVDRLLAQALRTPGDAARNALLGQASTLVFEDHALLPLHHEIAVWATRPGVTYTPRADRYTLAMAAGVR